jgi:L,D-peptidoglycan transpeptidase YkuD (ErfK/YbiS/YcfS/YnhG family)
MKTYQALKPKSYWLMKDKIKAYNKLQELKRIDKKRKRITALKEFAFVVGLFACAYLLLLIGSI